MTANTVIVGGGFVGLFTALHLRHRSYPNPVILIDSQDRFVFKPLLYEYLTGEMEEDQVTPTYADLLKGSDIAFVQGQVTAIDVHQRQVVLASLEIAMTTRRWFWPSAAFRATLRPKGLRKMPLRFGPELMCSSLRRICRAALRGPARSSDPAQRRKLLTFAVVGAGPSGVEIAATLADLLPDWYRQLDGDIKNIQIVVINHGKEILEGDINTALRDIATEALKNKAIPVKLKLGTAVKSVTPDQLCYETQDKQIGNLQTATTIWTSGTATNPLIRAMALPADCLWISTASLS